ncbi:MAG: trypsin-like peptidase domain-containing protein [Acidobacteria bacterium]|nr:trypsin-like peptidase domain-containing protein [Acidobacteriota bacterium]MBA3885481.1 trypsin-like peptidase domain-containing protein [Acidobacteriota bacterium]
MPRRLVLVVLVALTAFVASMVLTGRMGTAGDSAAQQQPDGAEPATQGRAVAAPAGLPDLTGVAERAVAAVTNISSTQIVRTPNSPFANDPFFRRFFGGDDAFGYRERRAQSLGSGVVVSADGYVLTNSHVINEGRGEVTVTLPDKREVPAQIIGVDEATDLAVLKIEARNLPTLPWGDSSTLRVAEWVLAIGNPFQLNQTVTLGIVSATGRSLGGRLATYEDFIQTDAAINPGNSGGALINARGELVGINTAIYSESGGYQGIGFAVPSNVARHVMEELITHGEVQRGTIAGIWLQPMTTQLAAELKAPNTRGALVIRMDQRGDAYQAGIRPGDIIVGFNGTSLDDAHHLLRLLADAQIGSTATLGLLRDGTSLPLRVPVVKEVRQRAR